MTSFETEAIRTGSSAVPVNLAASSEECQAATLSGRSASKTTLTRTPKAGGLVAVEAHPETANPSVIVAMILAGIKASFKGRVQRFHRCRIVLHEILHDRSC